MYTSKEILGIINETLASVSYDRSPRGLYDPIRYAMSLGGKRVRPVLLLMVYNLYHEDIRDALDAAIGIETYHNFTLLHDDVMDRAEMRRGKPCVHKVWDDNTAILSGDTMLIQAFQYMQKCSNEKFREILSLFTNTALEIDEGQQMDIDFEKRDDVTEPEYLEMIRLKTSVLLACAAKTGALLAGATEQDANILYTFAEQLGLAFQLQDDFLDVYGDSKTFGKKTGGDILCNKKTFMLINALLNASKEQRTELQQWIHTDSCDPDRKIEAVTHLYSAIGVDRLAQSRIDSYFAEAGKTLRSLSIPTEKTHELWAFALQLMGRKS